ncbi:toll/interleukin-1 receptor domain-containing protein [Bradyrhizobium monzae]|uniref:toll/interleukin-1 receptor domain-containing protein n=1 Tax=Bradyrhizobium sp. Oc8 TaxID=2876780 RepID=UPI001F19B626|nr:toll/interleukin-1 receptor domain-containing protein [Bradyrhizobium sp. Oc8]
MSLIDRWFKPSPSTAPQPLLSPNGETNRVGVFVSYNHSETKIADALVETLTSLSPDLDVFIDHAGLEASDDYEAKISSSIRASQWFVIIYSGGAKPDKDMSWCFYEAGQFRAKLEAADQVKSIRERICYLYDGERPSQLSRYQGSFISTTDRARNPLNITLESDDSLGYENTELFDFLELVLTKSEAKPLRDLQDPVVRKLMRAGVRKVTLAFWLNRINDIVGEEVFQPRISFRIPPPVLPEGVGLSADTIVTGEYRALQDIFSIASTDAVWSDIKAKSTKRIDNGMIPLWINDLEAAAREVGRGDVPRQTDFLCLGTDGRYYRPIIARYEKFRSGAKKCYVAFIPSRDRRFNLTFKTSLLLSALILSIRFRQRVLPLADDLKKAGQAPEPKKAELLQKIQNEIVMVEAEAMEFGLSPPKDEHDEPPLLSSFRDGPDKEFMREEIIKWSTTRLRIFSTIGDARDSTKTLSWSEAATTVITNFANLYQINGRFVDLLCNELLYAEKIERPDDK